MITHTDRDSIERYRERLGKELYTQLIQLWEEGERLDCKEAEVAPSADVVAATAVNANSDTVDGSDIDKLESEKAAAENGDCPNCDTPAEMGILLKESEEGKGSSRRLWCGICENCWDYERIRCTRCGTRTQQALSYHFDEGNNGRRIYFCQECEGSQKVLCEKDLKDFAKIDLRLESILMSPLEEAVRAHCLAKKIAANN